MPRFHHIKAELMQKLGGEDWEAVFPALRSSAGMEYVAPLLGLLPRGGLLRWRAAHCLGVCMAALAARDMERARTVMRRLMWHMNEESGNLGWGIPESMGEILSQSPPLAKEFSRILFSYITDTGRADNYVDHAPLLRACFWACGHLAQARPDYGVFALSPLVQGLGAEDAQVRAQAALALLKLLKSAKAGGQGLAASIPEDGREKLAAMRGEATECEDFDGQNGLYRQAGELAQEALALLEDKAR